MPSNPPPREAKLIRRRLNDLNSKLSALAYGRLTAKYDPRTRIFEILPGQGSISESDGFRLYDGVLVLNLKERHIVSGGERQILAYNYQLAWPANEGAYQGPNDWIFRFDYNSSWKKSKGFAHVPHLNAHHPDPVGPNKMHYPTGVLEVDRFFEIIQAHFPQRVST